MIIAMSGAEQGVRRVAWRGWGRRRDLRLAYSLEGEANRLLDKEQWAAGEAALRRVVELRGRWLAADSLPVLVARHNLAMGLFVMRRHEEAAAEVLEVLPALVAAWGEEDPMPINTRLLLSVSLLRLRRFEESEEQCRLVLACHTAVDDVRVKAIRSQALALVGLGRYREATEVLEAFLREAVPVLGAGHPDVLKARILVLNQLAVLAEHEVVERECQDLLDTLDERDPQHGQVAGIRVYQLNDTGRHTEAETTAREALAHHSQLALHIGLARSLNGQARHHEALHALADAQTQPRADSAGWKVLTSSVAAQALLGLGHLDQAEAKALQAVQAAEEAGLAPTRHRALEAATTLGLVLAAQGRHIEAQQHLTRTTTAWHDHYGPHHPRTLASQAELATLQRL
ncbi:tetratricopeptide repeat protein [Kitasatospora sp. NPDC058965]|uniref:tetratricopeptide repeat protein n=1 Tax=Kitasatospora sp. NPDC058965 TaxID=3346682 RepID=UPI00367F3D18